MTQRWRKAKTWIILLSLCLGSAGLTRAAAAFDCTAATPVQAATGQAQPNNADWWQALYHGQLNVAHQQLPQTVFLGDSITEWWPVENWQAQFAALKPLNFGIHGDKVENLLWRFDNAGPDVWNAKAFVLLIGTNNISLGSSADDVANGIRWLLHDIRGKAPEAKIILIGITPREAGANNWIRKAIATVNTNLQTCAALPNVAYLSVDNALADKAGKPNDGMKPDQLHPSLVGYERLGPLISRAVAP